MTPAKLTTHSLPTTAVNASTWVHRVCIGALAATLFVGAGSIHTARAETVATPAPNVSQTLPVFQHMRLASAIDVEFSQVAAGTPATIVLTGPADSVARMRLRVEGGVLHIESQKCVGFCGNWLRGVRAQVSAAAVEGLEIKGSGDLSAVSIKQPKLHLAVAGSGDVAIKNLEVDELNVAVAGSGDVRAAGAAKRQRISIAGSGDVSAKDLRGQEVVVKIAGSGDAHVWAEQALSVSLVGSGDVTYRGSPTQKSVSKVGSGDVIQMK